MKRINQRGEITTTILIVSLIGSFIVGAVGATKLNPFKSIFGNSQQSAVGKSASFSKQSEKYKPVVFKAKDGNEFVVANEVELNYETGQDFSVPKPTLGQKIGSFFFGLATWTIIAIVVSLLFFGGAPIVIAWKKYLDMKQALKNTVSGIRNLDEETYKKVIPALAESQDKKDKIVIDKIKTELH